MKSKVLKVPAVQLQPTFPTFQLTSPFKATHSGQTGLLSDWSPHKKAELWAVSDGGAFILPIRIPGTSKGQGFASGQVQAESEHVHSLIQHVLNARFLPGVLLGGGRPIFNTHVLSTFYVPSRELGVTANKTEKSPCSWRVGSDVINKDKADGDESCEEEQRRDRVGSHGRGENEVVV